MNHFLLHPPLHLLVTEGIENIRGTAQSLLEVLKGIQLRHPPNQIDQNKKDECFPVPANTSASFLNQKQVEKLLEKQDRLPYQSR